MTEGSSLWLIHLAQRNIANSGFMSGVEIERYKRGTRIVRWKVWGEILEVETEMKAWKGKCGWGI